MKKLLEKKESRKLRKNGYSIKDIAKKLKVSPASVQKWCLDIKLTSSQKRKLKEKSLAALQKGRKKAARNQRRKKEVEIKTLKTFGIKEIGNLNEREFFLIGCGLYWAEGFKKDSRLGFANSDPKMIKFIIKWLIKICKVRPDQIRLRVGVNISHKERVSEIEQKWSKITRIPLSQFQKPFFQKSAWKKQFENRSQYLGVLRIRANKQRVLFRKIHGYIEGMKLNSAG